MNEFEVKIINFGISFQVRKKEFQYKIQDNLLYIMDLDNDEEMKPNCVLSIPSNCLLLVSCKSEGWEERIRSCQEFLYFIKERNLGLVH